MSKRSIPTLAACVLWLFACTQPAPAGETTSTDQAAKVELAQPSETSTTETGATETGTTETGDPPELALTEPEPPAQAAVPEFVDRPRRGNNARALVAHAKKLERIEVAAPDGRIVLELSPEVVAAIKAELIGQRPDWSGTFTSPPWEVVLLLHVAGVAEPFIGHPVGSERISISPVAPWSAQSTDGEGEHDPRILEVFVGDELFTALRRGLPKEFELAKEYTWPGRDSFLLKYRTPESATDED